MPGCSGRPPGPKFLLPKWFLAEIPVNHRIIGEFIPAAHGKRLDADPAGDVRWNKRRGGDDIVPLAQRPFGNGILVWQVQSPATTGNPAGCISLKPVSRSHRRFRGGRHWRRCFGRRRRGLGRICFHLHFQSAGSACGLPAFIDGVPIRSLCLPRVGRWVCFFSGPAHFNPGLDFPRLPVKKTD